MSIVRFAPLRDRCLFTAMLACVAILPFQPGKARAQPTLPCHKCDSHAEDCSDVPDPDSTGGFDTREPMSATDVLHVDLDLELLFGTRTVSATCKMTVKNVSGAPLSQFTFRLRRDSFTITQSTVTDPADNLDHAVTVTASSQTTRVATLNRAYQANEQFVLNITYNGAPFNGGSFGSFSWTAHPTASSNIIGASLSEPYYSYTWWPIKDGDVGALGDNGDKFTIDEHFTVPNTMLAPGNGVLSSVQALPDIGNGNGPRSRFNWTTAYPIASYLVMTSGTNYTTPAAPDPSHGFNSWMRTYTTGTGGSMPVFFYIWPEDDTTANRTAWEKCLNMLAAYRGRYGEYPFVNEKYGIYEFAFGGGQEHQTMTGEGTFSEYVTAHELGHQWWGDMITCKTWSDIWLNEGFATFTEAMWSELSAYPGPANFANYLNYMSNLRPSDTTLRSGTNYGGTVYRTDLSSASTIFSTTYSYRKGGWCLAMLRYIMGDTTFFQALANYRAAFQYSAATTDDFAAICSATYGQDLTWFFNQWVYSPGDPDYQWSSQSVVVNGQTYLMVYIKQVQQATNPTWPIFGMPVEIRYNYTNGQGQPATATTRVPWNADSPATTERWMTLRVTGTAPSGVQFDPDYRILRPAVANVAFVNGPPAIVSTSPAPQASIPAAAHTQSVSITYDLNVNTTASNYTLVGAATGTVPLTLSYNASNNTATLTASARFPVDHYTLTVSDSVVSAASSKQLDGEIANPPTLPSGNGAPGGPAVFSFDIVGSPADINGDGTVNSADLSLFVQVLLGLNTNPTYVARSDFNADSSADGADVPGFIAAYY